jgi:hypothetical protein
MSKHVPKALYTRLEIPIADEIMANQEGLIRDFMAGFADLVSAKDAHCQPVMEEEYTGVSNDYETSQNKYLVSRDSITKKWHPNPKSWMVKQFRFDDGYGNRMYQHTEQDCITFPTATNMLKKYDDICPIMNYSLIGPYTILQRHTGPENRDGKYIRVHVPLIIPKGDIFLEVYGNEVDWSDCFAFNNQLQHSAHNYSSEWRMVFLFDLDARAIGAVPGEPYDPELEANTPPFVRGWRYDL